MNSKNSPSRSPNDSSLNLPFNLHSSRSSSLHPNSSSNSLKDKFSVLAVAIITIIIITTIATSAVSATTSIDISICKDPDYEATYASCVQQFAPMKEAADKIKTESDTLSKEFSAPDSDYNTCLNQVCAEGTSSPLHEGETITTKADREECINTLCEPIVQSYNKKLRELSIEYNNKKIDYEAALCSNCVAPFCTYKHHQDCLALGPLCEEYDGAINYMGCGDDDSLNQPLINPEDVTIENPPEISPTEKKRAEEKREENKEEEKRVAKEKAGGKENSGTIKISSSKTLQSDKTLQSTLQTENQDPQTRLTTKKLAKIGKKQGTTAYQIPTGDGTKILVLKKPDNSKATIIDKRNYYVSNKAKSELGNAIGNIPLLGNYKDYIIKFLDDQKSDDQKSADTQVQLGVGKNAAVQFNKMDGTGDTELALSTGKNLVPSTPVTKPFEFIFSQLGTAVKKSMAHGFNSEYNSALEEAKVLRKAGLSWADTIRQTTKLVAEDTDGKRWVQTLNAFSKKDYQSQDARIKAYIMQMKMNGELK